MLNRQALKVLSCFTLQIYMVTNNKWLTLNWTLLEMCLWILISLEKKNTVSCRPLLTYWIRNGVSLPCSTYMSFRQAEYIYNGIKSSSSRLSEKKRLRHYRVMRMEDVDSCCIRMFECFLEAAPQLVLQIYILIIHRQEEEIWIIGNFSN